MKSQRLLLVSVAVVLLVGIVLVSVFLADSGPARAEEVRAVEASSRADESAEIARADVDGAARSAAAQRSTIASVADAGAAARADEVGAVRIVVVKRGTTEPVPGARVTVYEKGDGSLSLAEDEQNWLGPDAEATIERGGHARTADEHGEVALPLVRRTVFVAARKDDLFGALEIPRANDETFLLEIGPQHELHVRVVDAHGAAGKQSVIALAYCGQSYEVWRGRTDARGELTIRNLDFWLALNGLGGEYTFAVRLSTPCDPPIEEWLSPVHLPSEPIVLTEPATGSVKITVVDSLGKLVPISGHALLNAHTNARGVGKPYAFYAIDVRVPIVAGLAVVEKVALGLQLQIEADIDGTGDASTSVAGPTTSGERVEAAVTLPEDHCVLLGRVVDEQGHVVADTAFDWKRLVDDGQGIAASGRDVLRTDHEGHFLWTLRRLTAVNGLGASAHRIGFLCEVSNAPMRRAATIDFSRALPSGVLDLGDVMVAAHGPLVAGKVLDESEHPVVGARLALLVASGEAETYDDCASDIDGSFAIWGPCLPLEFTLSVWSAGHSVEQEPRFHCGDRTTDLVVHAKALGSLEGSALVDHEYEWSEVPLAFELPNGERPGSLTCTRVLDRITFTMSGLTAGKYRARVGFDDAPAIVQFEDVEIVAASRTRDPRLVELDLRGKLPKGEKAANAAHSIDLTVVDPRGKSLSRGFLWLRDADGNQEESLWGAGHAHLAVDEQRRIEIWSPGHRSTILHPPYSDARIVLASELVAELALVLPKELDSPEFTFSIDVEPRYADDSEAHDAPFSASRVRGLELGAGGKGELQLPAAGRYGFSLRIARHTSKAEEEIEDYGIGLVTSEFVVRETDGAQRFELRMDPDELAGFIEEFHLARH